MKSITNFRDLGGIKTASGESIRPHRLLRSGELSHVSLEEQTQLVEEFRLSQMVDFRTAAEIAEEPDVSIPGVAYHHLDIIGPKEESGASLEEFIQMGSIEQAHQHMDQLYKEFVHSEVAQSEYRRFLALVAAVPTDRSLLFHCFAGKDRTGIGAVLLLEILGADRTAIYADYLETNTLRISENNQLIAQARANGLHDDAVAALEVALRVEKRYLDVYYQEIEATYGAMEQYLDQVLGVNASLRARLQEQFVSA